MKELKIKIWNIENVVLMKILEQDECLRGKFFICENENGIAIKSYDSPFLSSKIIFIQGKNKEFDNKICSNEFNTVQEAKEYIEKVKEAVAEFNKSIKEEILDNEEKEYLRGVINPFRENVEYVCKKFWELEKREYLEIRTYQKCNEYMVMPSFEENSMYRGMELNKKYHIKELNLWE